MKVVTEWLVRRVDRVGNTPEQDCRMTKRGDVIVVKEAPCAWSQTEMNSPDWIIVQTDMTMNDARAYLEAEHGEAEEVPLLKIRSKGIRMHDLSNHSTVPDHKDIHPFREPFIISKEVIDQFTAVKAPAQRMY